MPQYAAEYHMVITVMSCDSFICLCLCLKYIDKFSRPKKRGTTSLEKTDVGTHSLNRNKIHKTKKEATTKTNSKLQTI